MKQKKVINKKFRSYNLTLKWQKLHHETSNFATYSVYNYGWEIEKSTI